MGRPPFSTAAEDRALPGVIKRLEAKGIDKNARPPPEGGGAGAAGARPQPTQSRFEVTAEMVKVAWKTKKAKTTKTVRSARGRVVCTNAERPAQTEQSGRPPERDGAQGAQPRARPGLWAPRDDQEEAALGHAQSQSKGPGRCTAGLGHMRFGRGRVVCMNTALPRARRYFTKSQKMLRTDNLGVDYNLVRDDVLANRKARGAVPLGWGTCAVVVAAWCV